MTITLHWWYLPLLLVALGIGIPALLRDKGDYDFLTPMLKVAIFGVCMSGALFFTIAKVAFQ